MPRVNIEFNIPDEIEEYKIATKAGDMASALFEIRQEVFRPARKHGYSNRDIQNLLEKMGPDGYELVSLLEQQFSSICDERGVLEFT